MDSEAPLDPGQPTEAARQIVGILQRRDNSESSVRLLDGRVYRVMNIAWGIDALDTAYHITTNISPDVDGYSIDVFRTDEVDFIVDTASGSVLHRHDSSMDSTKNSE
jgi:hypothetical protein